MKTFADSDLLPSLRQTLVAKNLIKTTEIQARIIPLLMSRKSVIGISETGSGKTLAYALPLLHLLKSLENQGDPVKIESTPRAIVMAPTRELGEQISKVFKTLTHETRLRVRPALGGMSLEQARRNVSGAFEVLLATPGRLKQLMELGQIKLDDVRVLIFDEADQMLDEGFLPYSKLVAEACPKGLQLGMFSATVSPSVQELMTGLFSGAEVIRSAGSGKVVPTLVTKNLTVEDGKRWPLLEKILKTPSKGGTLIFTNTREQCDKLAKELTDKGFRCGIYRGEMDKNFRRTTLKRFREGTIDLLVSTDLGGRGLDIENVARIINYHLPKESENYLHRVGRTARAGRAGLVINLVTERDEPLMAKLDGKSIKPKQFKPNSHSSPTKSAQGKPIPGKFSPQTTAKSSAEGKSRPFAKSPAARKPKRR